MSAQMIVYTNDCDYVVASSAEDALNVFMEHIGAGAGERGDYSPFRPFVSKSGALTIEGEKKTLGEWAAANGRGYLCCSEDP